MKMIQPKNGTNQESKQVWLKTILTTNIMRQMEQMEVECIRFLGMTEDHMDLRCRRI